LIHFSLDLLHDFLLHVHLIPCGNHIRFIIGAADMDLTSDFHSYHEKVTRSLVDIVKTGGQISNADLGFHRSNDKVSRSLDQQNARLLRLTNKLLKAATQDSPVKPPSLRDHEGVEDNWRGVVEVVDDMLEKADASLDEFTGAINRMSPTHQDGAQTPSRQPAQALPASTPRQPISRPVFPTKVVQKPQTLFARKVDNFSSEPFKPLLVAKPHCIISLEDSLTTTLQKDNSYEYRHVSNRMRGCCADTF
jgi:exosome complex exonuclease RRP6